MENVRFYGMIDKNRREYLIHRVMENSEKRLSGCREWIKTRNNKGYGLISFTATWQGVRSVIPVSRAIYQAFYNVILERNQYVCHTCDNPSCVEITHLFVGSPSDNQQDMLRKGRNAKKYAAHKRLRVHSDDKILAIKNAIGSLREVSECYGVSQSYVSRLRAGKAKTLVK